MAAARVKSARGEGWAVVRLSSPDGLIRLGAATLRSLKGEVEGILSGDSRCLGILGEGRSFAVGADLGEMALLSPRSAGALSDLANGVIRLLENCTIPVVAGIDGVCLGGGLDLALGADWRIASSSSVFGHPGADLGIITGFGGTQRLPRLAGQCRARGWVFSAARFGAPEAYASGLVQELCTRDEFPAAFEKRVKTFAGMPQKWLREWKAALRNPGGKGSLRFPISGPGIL